MFREGKSLFQGHTACQCGGLEKAHQVQGSFHGATVCLGSYMNSKRDSKMGRCVCVCMQLLTWIFSTLI